MDIGGHKNSTLEQGQCFVKVLTLPQTTPEGTSNLDHFEQPLAKARGDAHSRGTYMAPLKEMHGTPVVRVGYDQAER